MLPLAEFEELYQSAINQAEGDYKNLLKILNENRPTPYIRLKSIEVYSNIVVACNVLNKLKYQILQMTQEVNTAKANNEDNDEISSTILKVHDLAEFHDWARKRYLRELREMIKNKIAQKWRLIEFMQWKTFQGYCASYLDRVVE